MSLHHSALFRVSDWKHIFILDQASLLLVSSNPMLGSPGTRTTKLKEGQGDALTHFDFYYSTQVHALCLLLKEITSQSKKLQVNDGIFHADFNRIVID